MNKKEGIMMEFVELTEKEFLNYSKKSKYTSFFQMPESHFLCIQEMKNGHVPLHKELYSMNRNGCSRPQF